MDRAPKFQLDRVWPANVEPFPVAVVGIVRRVPLPTTWKGKWCAGSRIRLFGDPEILKIETINENTHVRRKVVLRALGWTFMPGWLELLARLRLRHL